MPKKEGTPTKTDFVRALPATMPAKEVVEKAKEAGLKLSAAYVYVIRSQGRGGSEKAKAPRAKSSSKGAEARLLAAAGELGLTRSIELLQAEKARLVRLLR